MPLDFLCLFLHEGQSSCSTHGAGTAVDRQGKREVIDRVDENYIR